MKARVQLDPELVEQILVDSNSSEQRDPPKPKHAASLEVSQLKQRIDYAAFYREHVNGLRTNGGLGDVKADCPNCAAPDKTQALSVNLTEGLWRCHRCDLGGDVLCFVENFILKTGGFPAALKYVAAWAGVELATTERTRPAEDGPIDDAPPPGESTVIEYDTSRGWRDATVAAVFASMLDKQVRYNHTRHKWMLWVGDHWNDDKYSAVMKLARATANKAVEASLQVKDDDLRKRAIREALGYLSHRNLENMLKQAASMNPLAISDDELNSDPWKLNVKNGTLDLKTGTLHPHDPTDMFDYLLDVAYDPEAECKRWEQFLMEVFNVGDPDEAMEIIRWLQQVIGYSLTGEFILQIFMMLIGEGANGKSVFLETASALFGALSRSIGEGSLTQKVRKGESASGDIARLEGARFATCSEFTEGMGINESLLKDLTGGDRIQARRLYQEEREFVFAGTLWVRSNHEPEFKGVEDGLWRRVKLVPFRNDFKGADDDPSLSKTLAGELPGILAWALRGLEQFLANGKKLPPCPTVDKMTNELRNRLDVVREFAENHCAYHPDQFTTNAEVLKAIGKVYGRTGLTKHMLTRRLKRVIKSGLLEEVEYWQRGKRGWMGLKLVDIPEGHS